MKRRYALLLALATAVGAALADNMIEVQPNDPNGYWISPFGDVILLRADTFTVRASDDESWNGLGDIRSIVVAEGVSGVVNVSVTDGSGGLGANWLGWIDLTNATTGNIVDVRVYGIGDDPNYEPTRATAITGNFLPRTIYNDVHIQFLPAGALLGGDPADPNEFGHVATNGTDASIDGRRGGAKGGERSARARRAWPF